MHLRNYVWLKRSGTLLVLIALALLLGGNKISWSRGFEFELVFLALALFLTGALIEKVANRYLSKTLRA
jgi:hypothetical protein